MTAQFARNPLGRAAPLAALAAAAAVIALTAVMKERAAPSAIAAPPAETRLLRFSDEAGGVVRVASTDGVVIASYGSGEGAFLRGVLRSFARDRRSADVGSDIPFALTRHADGRTSLKDMANGQVVVLDAFGSTNAAMFAALLRNSGDKP